MKALILGAGGQVGRALAETAPAGARVTALSRAQCDLEDPAAIRAAIDLARPEIVFNAAAYTDVDKAESEPGLAHRVNAIAPGLIADAARGRGARIVQVSTDFVFDGNAPTPRSPDDPAGPQGVYARSKHAGELAVIAADPEALIVRTAWVYAPEGRNFVNKMLRLMRERERIGVVADQVGTPTWAPSIAAALWSLAAAGATGVHHYTDAGVASWYDFAVAIEEDGRACGLLTKPVRVLPIRTADFLSPAPRPAYSVLDTTATWNLLGGPAPHWRTNLRRDLEALGNA